ncbi:phosphate ABC transporter permease PstA [Mesomycoplasma moatsii]|uniref:phosphate ABC transporter permease PstA n=1 Tax=Mesomycoplasma moatsii TaxID=171287 RepID=UPI0003B3DFC9
MKKIENQYKLNKIAKWTSLTFSLFMILLFVVLVIFIFIFAIQGFVNFGIVNILFSGKFDASKDQYSFWIPFSITILTSLIALIIAVPIGIRVALFTKYRLPKNYRKSVLVIFQVLSGIPSVIFGLFAEQSLGKIWNTLFGISPNSIFNGSIMLCFMVIPTIVTMTLDALNNIEDTLINNPLALGNTKTRAIYKVAKKAAKPEIVVAVILAISRAIGESMAVSMILQAQPSSAIYTNGFGSFLNSSSQTLGAFISTAMFADKDPEKIRPLLYTFGFLMLLTSMILNLFILSFSRKRNKKNKSWFYRFEQNLYEYVSWIPLQFKIIWERIIFKSKNVISVNNVDEVPKYIRDRNINYKFQNVYPIWKIFWEIFFTLICFSFVCWIVGDIIFNGILGINEEPKLFFLYSKNSTTQSLINTFLIIFICLVIGFPLSLLVAIYLNEFSINKTFKKVILFFLDSLGTTPSIIFGMFGLLLFIQTFGWSSNGVYGNSLIAGALTLIIVIIPSFTRLLEQSLKNVPKEIRLNSFALGNTRLQTIWKLVLPMALISITTSIISTIGRIFSETAPLYLTAGLSSSKYSMLNRPGTTLTTQIYAQIFSPNSNAIDIQYQAAFMTIIFILCLILVGYVLIPNRKKIKNWIQNFKISLIKPKNQDNIAL